MGAFALRRFIFITLVLTCLPSAYAVPAGEEKKTEQGKAEEPPVKKADEKGEKEKGEKETKLTEEQNKKLDAWIEKNKEKNPELAELFEKWRKEITNFDELLLENPELKDLLQSGAAPAPKTVLKAMRKAVAKRLGLDEAGGESALPQALTEKDVAPNFNDHNRSFMPEGEQGFSGVARGPCGGPGGNSPGGNSPGGGHDGSPGGTQGRTVSNDSPFIEEFKGELPTKGLRRAGENSRKSFEVVSRLAENTTGSCQGTLIKRDSNIANLTGPAIRAAAQLSEEPCDLAIAAHCVVHEGRRVRQYSSAYGSFVAERVELSDSPQIGSASDAAHVRFRGEVCRKMRMEAVPEVPVCASPVRRGDVVAIETRYFNKRHAAMVTSVIGTATTVDVNFLDRSTGSHQGGIHTGDSGGPMFAKDASSPTGGECLAGVLSASQQAATVHRTVNGKPTIGGVEGYYNSDLDFFRSRIALADRRVPTSTQIGSVSFAPDSSLGIRTKLQRKD